MALDATTRETEATPALSPDRGDRFADLYETDTGRSNFGAFLLGGVVIAGGMLAFLYYDNDNFGRHDDMTTGSIAPISTPGAAGPVPSVKIPIRPAPIGETNK